MGLRTPPTNGTSPYPARGVRRNRSSSGSFSGALGVIANDRRLRSRRISQATLQKIFIAMMTTAFSLYLVFTAYIIHLHHQQSTTTTSTDTGGSLGGPHSLNEKTNNDEILRAHIQRLKDDQLKVVQGAKGSSLFKGNNDTESLVKIHHHQQLSKIGSDVSAASPKFLMEEVDIHDMKHPKEIQKEPLKASASKVVSANDNKPPETAQNRILKAYLEPISVKDWERKPLLVRSTSQEDLQVVEYPRVMQSCSRLPELWPIDDFPDADPFLP